MEARNCWDKIVVVKRWLRFLPSKIFRKVQMFPREPVRASLFVAVSVAALCLAASSQICPARPAAGSVVQDPLALYSQNGVLTAGITMGSFLNQSGLIMYCFAYP